MFDFISNLRRKVRYAIRSPKWQTIRKKHLEKNPECAVCGKNKKIEVHHIVPVHVSPELELDPSNLISLCDNPCHLVFGHFFDYKSWNINVREDAEVYNNRLRTRPKK